MAQHRVGEIDYGWGRADCDAAFAEGWGLYERNDGTLEIEKVDDPDPSGPSFATDDEALNHVRNQAASGSPLHQLALSLDGKRWRE